MNDFENVSELVNKTGASFEEARYAYEACGKDMVSAAIMLEKARSSRKYANSARNKARESFVKNRRTAAFHIRSFFDKLCRNSVSVCGSREYFRVPIIGALLCLILLGELLVPAVLISVFCGVRYVFSGVDFAKEFVFGFTKTANSAVNPDYSYTPCDDSCDNGFFNKS